MEERELFERYRATRDPALRNRIAEKYLYVAAMIAKKFVGRGVEFDDLYQVASLALLKGIDRFDETKGVKFTTFITPTVAGEIKNYFRDRSRLIHLPRRVAELRQSVKAASDALFSEEGRHPSPAEIAQKLGVSEEDVLSAMEPQGVLSLDTPAGTEGDETNLYELIPDKNDAIENFEQRDAVRAAMSGLSERERELVGYRFGQELSQSETAKKLNVSQMYVSRMERKILDKLRENLKKSMAD